MKEQRQVNETTLRGNFYDNLAFIAEDRATASVSLFE